MGVLSTYYKGFTFDGINSRAYGVYVADVNVFNAPERDVEMISVPGRNGDLTIDRGRFENIEVEYDCFVAGDDESDFNSAIANFRNALASRIGYKRMVNDFYPDEYRMASFIGGISVSQIGRRAGNFKIGFNCMPQRWLTSGEVPKVMVRNMTPSSTNTESGSIVSIESDGGDAVTSLVAQIEPVQSGSGDPSPTNVRAITGWTAANVNVAGKNLLDTSGMSTAGQNQAIFTRDADGSIYVGGKAVNTVYRIIGSVVTKAGERYTLTGTPAGGGSGKYRMTVAGFGYDNGNGYTFTGDGETHNVSIDIFTGYPQSGTLEFKPMLRLASDTDDTYEPYTGNTVTVSFGSAGTVYGGTLDVVTGALTVTHKIFAIYSDWNWIKSSTYPGGFYASTLSTMGFKANTPVICSHAKTARTISEYLQGTCYVDGSLNLRIMSADSTVDDWKNYIRSEQSAGREITVCGELVTPITVQLTPAEVELLAGQNNVWADTGDITITWGDDPYKVVNPTLFESKPLIEVTGHGVLTIGSQSITINGTSSTQVIHIDCDTMEAWEMSGSAMISRNDYIQNAGDDFPVLVPGANKITLGVGITQVVVTPRWWRV